ncbi:MAG: hypothetical protein V7K50_29035 [Nostoc sp.]|uniref:hypothetical protein n=1 Tax=Nostoc sp. TaxID=1180 RepID=UPI002FFC2A7B
MLWYLMEIFNAVDNWRKRSLTSKLDSCDRNSGGIYANRSGFSCNQLILDSFRTFP